MLVFAFFASLVLSGFLLWCIFTNIPLVLSLFRRWSRRYAGGLTLVNAGMYPSLTSVDPYSNKNSQHIRRCSINYPMSKFKSAAMPSPSRCLLATCTTPRLEFSTSTLLRFSSSARHLCTNAHPSLYKEHSKPPAKLSISPCHLRKRYRQWTRRFPNQEESSKQP